MLSLVFLELTLRQVFADVPRDAGAILIYLILALFVGLTWAGSRKRRADPPGGKEDGHAR